METFVKLIILTKRCHSPWLQKSDSTLCKRIILCSGSIKISIINGLLYSKRVLLFSLVAFDSKVSNYLSSFKNNYKIIVIVFSISFNYSEFNPIRRCWNRHHNPNNLRLYVLRYSWNSNFNKVLNILKPSP